MITIAVRLNLLCIFFLFSMYSVHGNHERSLVVDPASRDSSGIYLTLDDFLLRQLSMAYECGTKRSRLKISDKPGISIVRNSSRHKFRLDEIFGFRKCGVDYRAYADRYFEILSNKVVFIYKHTFEEEIGRNFRKITTYYFSESAGSALFPLTRHYLTWIFRYNEELVQLIETSVSNDDEFLHLDPSTNMYKIESILLSLTK